MQERKGFPLLPVWLKQYPSELLEGITELAIQHGKKLFFAGCKPYATAVKPRKFI